MRDTLTYQKRYRFEVECATSLDDALSYLERVRVDIVLLDLGTSESRILETLRRVYASAPDIPLVVITDQQDEKLAAKVMREGAQDCLNREDLRGQGLVQAIRYAILRSTMMSALERRVRTLVAREANFRALARNLEALVVVDEQGIVRFVNPAAEIMLGGSAEQLRDHDLVLSLPAGETAQMELRRPDGVSVMVEIRAAATRWDKKRAFVLSLRKMDKRRIHQDEQQALPDTKPVR